MLDTRCPPYPVAGMSGPTEYAFSPRVQLCLNSICATLRATLPARAIADDIDNVAESITILGKQHHAWVGDRGLPNTFDHHDTASWCGTHLLTGGPVLTVPVCRRRRWPV